MREERVFPFDSCRDSKVMRTVHHSVPRSPPVPFAGCSRQGVTAFRGALPDEETAVAVPDVLGRPPGRQPTHDPQQRESNESG